jgi:hypothetical protein
MVKTFTLTIKFPPKITNENLIFGYFLESVIS